MSTLISHKIDFKAKKTLVGTECYFIMIETAIDQEVITIIKAQNI